jgi:hypothetical protein
MLVLDGLVFDVEFWLALEVWSRGGGGDGDDELACVNFEGTVALHVLCQIGL